jgi:hypothetical protein
MVTPAGTAGFDLNDTGAAAMRIRLESRTAEADVLQAGDTQYNN